jgi:hypothetical protein
MKRRLRVEMGDLRAEVGDLRAEVGDLRAEVGDLRAEVGDLRAEVGDLRVEKNRPLRRCHADTSLHLLERYCVPRHSVWINLTNFLTYRTHLTNALVWIPMV